MTPESFLLATLALSALAALWHVLQGFLRTVERMHRETTEFLRVSEEARSKLALDLGRLLKAPDLNNFELSEHIREDRKDDRGEEERLAEAAAEKMRRDAAQQVRADFVQVPGMPEMDGM